MKLKIYTIMGLMIAMLCFWGCESKKSKVETTEVKNSKIEGNKNLYMVLLKNTSCDEAVKLINKKISNNPKFSQDVKIISEPRRNALLMINASEDEIMKIKKLISTFD